MALDLDRGVKIRVHPQSRMKIAMYIDEPGDYYSEAGDPIDAKLAEAAGFDVKADARRKLVNRQVADYKRKLESEMQSQEEAIAIALSEGGEYDVRHVGAGQYALFGADGVRVTPGTMSKADIEVLIGRKIDAVGGKNEAE